MIEDNMSIKELIEQTNSFEEFYNYLSEGGIGDWDNVNSKEIIMQYCNEMMSKGIQISHIIAALENNPSEQDLYCIWLGNSMETPTPINTKEDLVEALGLEIPTKKEEKYSVTIDIGSRIIEVKAKSKEEAENKALEKFENDFRENNMIDEYWVAECDLIKDVEGE